jgi:hypothetical protein
MLSNWLNQKVRHPSVYKFPVTNVTELVAPDEGIRDYLALALLLAHGNPQQIRDQYQLLLRDAEDNSLNILKKYLQDRIFPREKRISVRVGNFGEVWWSQKSRQF